MPFSLLRQHIYIETLYVAGPVLKGLFRVFSECEVLAFAYRKLGNVRMLLLSGLIISLSLNWGVWRPSKNLHNDFTSGIEMLVSDHNILGCGGWCIVGCRFLKHGND